MSYLNDKVPCAQCQDLFDPDQLYEEGKCRDCINDDAMLSELLDEDEGVGPFDDPALDY